VHWRSGWLDTSSGSTTGRALGHLGTAGGSTTGQVPPLLAVFSAHNSEDDATVSVSANSGLFKGAIESICFCMPWTM